MPSFILFHHCYGCNLKKKSDKMYGIAMWKVKVGTPILNPFEESEFNQSVL